MKFITTILLMILLQAVNLNNIVKVSIFYESFCPDSKKFFDNQLVPIYSEIRNIALLEYIPFGKASSINGGEAFICQHGPKECRGNMVHSCGLHLLDTKDEQVRFVVCQMRAGDREPTGKMCIEQIRPGSFPLLNDCVEGPLGRQLQLLAEAATLVHGNPQLKFVPTIVYNDKFDQALQDRSQHQFANVFCEMINNELPLCRALMQYMSKHKEFADFK